MAEVVDWSPVDDDNNTAPPVGAPEGMMPSAVNNTLRAMMASLRRMYDQIVAGTLALPYLPTAGGVVSGNVAVNGTGGVALSGVQLRNISSGLEVYNASGGTVTSRGPGAGFRYGDQNQTSATWAWYASDGTSYLNVEGTGNVLGVSGAGYLTAPSMGVAGAITAGTTITATGNMYAAGYYSDGVAVIDSAAGNTLIYKGGGSWGIQLQAANTFYDNNQHIFRNVAGDETFTIDVSGNIITAGSISSTNAYAEISLNAAVFQSSIVCHGTIDAANYTRLGGPMFLITETQYNDITTRLAHLETQLKERS